MEYTALTALEWEYWVSGAGDITCAFPVYTDKGLVCRRAQTTCLTFTRLLIYDGSDLIFGIQLFIFLNLILETSHRSSQYAAINKETADKLRQLL